MECVLQFGKSIRPSAGQFARGSDAFTASAVCTNVFRLFLFDFDIFHNSSFTTRGFELNAINLLHCGVNRALVILDTAYQAL
jgi:hypothetical protein